MWLACGGSSIDSQETRLLASGVPRVGELDQSAKQHADGGPCWWWCGFICDGEARLSV